MAMEHLTPMERIVAVKTVKAMQARKRAALNLRVAIGRSTDGGLLIHRAIEAAGIEVTR